MAKKGVKNKNVSKAKAIQKKPLGFSKQKQPTSKTATILQKLTGFSKVKTIPNQQKPTNFSKTKTPAGLQTPVSFSNREKQKYYWAIFFYGALILLILLGVLLLVKYGEDLAGKATGVAKLVQIDGSGQITNIAQDSKLLFSYNNKKYKMNVGILTSDKVPVSISQCGTVYDPECVLKEVCNNKIDDDEDGQFDCNDIDCYEDTLCFQTSEICDDNSDNDADTFIDCNDIDCFKYDSCLVTSDNKVLFKLEGAPSLIEVYPWGLTTTSGYDACKKQFGMEKLCSYIEIYELGVWKPINEPNCLANKNYLPFYNAVRAVCEPPATTETFCNVDNSYVTIAKAGSPSDITCYEPNTGEKGCVENKFERCLYMEKKELAEWKSTIVNCDDIVTDIQGSLSYRAVCGDKEIECSNQLDDNDDGNVDCLDKDCVNNNWCIELQCNDGNDNDGDSWFDCSDSNCFGTEDCPQSPTDTSGNVIFALNTIKGNVGDIVEVPIYLERKSNIDTIEHITFEVQFDNTKLSADIDPEVWCYISSKPVGEQCIPFITGEKCLNAEGIQDTEKKCDSIKVPEVTTIFSWMKENVDSDATNAPNYDDNADIYQFLGDDSSLPNTNNDGWIEVDSPLKDLSKEDLLVSFDGNNKIKVMIDVPLGDSIFGEYETLKEILKLKFKILDGVSGVVPVIFVEASGKAVAFFTQYPNYMTVGLLHDAEVGYKNQGAVIAVNNFEILCTDTIDNDGDNLIDCADSDCAGQLGKKGQICEHNDLLCSDTPSYKCKHKDPTCIDTFDKICEAKETSCSDTFDNDGDTLEDCNDNDCSCWSSVTIPFTTGLNGITASINKIIAVGLNDKILNFKDNSWTTSSTDLDTNLFDAWITDSGLVYIIDEDGHVMRILVDETIEVFQTSITSSLTSIYGVNEGLAYIVGKKGTLLKYDGTQDGVDIDDNIIQGAIIDLSSTTYVQTQFTNLWVSSNKNVYITAYDGTVVKYNPTSSQYTPLIINICKDVVVDSNGQIVQDCKSNIINPITKKSDYVFEGIWGSSETDIYVVGRYSGTSDTAVILHYDGTEWSNVLEKKIAASKGFNSIFGKDAVNIFVVGAVGTIVHYDGTKWEEMESKTDKELYDLAITIDKVYAVGDNVIIQYSLNGGQ